MTNLIISIMYVRTSDVRLRVVHDRFENFTARDEEEYVGD